MSDLELRLLERAADVDPEAAELHAAARRRADLLTPEERKDDARRAVVWTCRAILETKLKNTCSCGSVCHGHRVSYEDERVKLTWNLPGFPASSLPVLNLWRKGTRIGASGSPYSMETPFAQWQGTSGRTYPEEIDHVLDHLPVLERALEMERGGGQPETETRASS